MRKLLAIPATLVALTAVAAPAQAGIGWELDAADQVERVLDHRNGSFTYVANCRSTSSRTFTCSWSGFKDNGVADGRATVRKINRYTYRARITSFRATSF
jgi:hypothetical protein